MDGMVDVMPELPLLALQRGWPFLAIAQVGFFAVAFAVYLLWPRHPRWLTKEYTGLVPAELFAALLAICVIQLTISSAPVLKYPVQVLTTTQE